MQKNYEYEYRRMVEEADFYPYDDNLFVYESVDQQSCGKEWADHYHAVLKEISDE
jgi:hypothetical protein